MGTHPRVQFLVFAWMLMPGWWAVSLDGLLIVPRRWAFLLEYPRLPVPGLWAGIMVCLSFARDVGLFYLVGLIGGLY